MHSRGASIPGLYWGFSRDFVLHRHLPNQGPAGKLNDHIGRRRTIMTGLSASKLDADTPAPQIAAQGHRALPAWVYSHPALTALEIERVLMPSWQIVCHVNSIPRPGDYETLDLGAESVFALRDKDGSIKAFHNVCRHRGARLL